MHQAWAAQLTLSLLIPASATAATAGSPIPAFFSRGLGRHGIGRPGISCCCRAFLSHYAWWHTPGSALRVASSGLHGHSRRAAAGKRQQLHGQPRRPAAGTLGVFARLRGIPALSHRNSSSNSTRANAGRGCAPSCAVALWGTRGTRDACRGCAAAAQACCCGYSWPWPPRARRRGPRAPPRASPAEPPAG